MTPMAGRPASLHYVHQFPFQRYAAFDKVLAFESATVIRDNTSNIPNTGAAEKRAIIKTTIINSNTASR
jgi:hypothetical protein